MKTISILAPTYNEEKNLYEFQHQIDLVRQQLPQYLFEIIYINDGSKDESLRIIKSLRSKDNCVNYIDLSRNFGKEAAMLAGIDFAKGDCVIIMDTDLQDPPHLIIEMIKYWEEGYDDIYAKRNSRGKESWIRRKASLLFYSILKKTTKVDILANVGDFRLFDRKCIDSLKQLRETQRYTKGLFAWIGYRKKEITFDRADRHGGTSSFNFFKLFDLAIEGITSFTTTPLRISAIIGFLISLFALIYVVFMLIKTLLYGDSVQGFPTLIITILFLGGIQLISLGIIGEYLGRIFHETKNRPNYLVQSFNGEDKTKKEQP